MTFLPAARTHPTPAARVRRSAEHLARRVAAAAGLGSPAAVALAGALGLAGPARAQSQTAPQTEVPAPGVTAAPVTAPVTQPVTPPVTPPPQALPAEAFFRPPEVLDASLSPSGQWLAITTAAGAERVSLVVFDLRSTDQRTPARRLVQFRDADVSSVHWVAEDRLVFSVTELDTPSGERPGSGLYGVNVDGNDLRQLIARRAARGAVEPRAGMGREALSPYHRLLFVPAPGAALDPRQGQVIVGLRQIDGRNNLREVVPLWLDTRTGRTRSLDLPVPPGAQQWVFDGRGRPAAVTTLQEGRQTLLWRPPDAPADAPWQRLAEGPVLSLPYVPRFVGDDGSLVVEHLQGPDGMSVLSRFDFATGRPAAGPWVRAPGFDFQGSVLRTEGGGGIAGVRLVTDAESAVWTDPAYEALQQKADAHLPGRVNRLSCRRCGQPDAVALVDSFSDRHPGTLWLWRAATGRWQVLADRRPGLREEAMATVEFHRIKARDGHELPLWLTRPAASRAGTPLPAVVLVHGGPWVRGGQWQWEAMAQFLASRGYLVISPEFRGSRGYGQAHHRAGFKQWGQAMQDDVADALLWAQAQKLADGRACIAGASYGGYATLMGLVRHPQLYRCGVAWVALTDIFLLLEGSFWVNDDTSSTARQYTLPEMIGDVQADAEMLRRASPVLLADQMRAPLLLVFGEADRRVPLAHGQRLRKALREAGREPEWVTYAGEGHSGWRIDNRIDLAQRIETFLAQHLGLAAPTPAASPAGR